MMGGFSTVGGVSPDYYYGYILSNDVLQANDASKCFSATSYTKAKEIQITNLAPSPTTLRTYFEIYTTNTALYAYGRIYRNGSAYGTERYTSSTTPVAFTEDLQFSVGDYVQLYAYNSVCVQNFRILGKVIVVSAIQSKAFTAVNTLT